MIDWNDNAKAAVREFAEYVGETKHCERYLELIVPKQTKTVADAVEWNEKVFKSKEWQNDKCDYIVLYANSFSYSSSKNNGDVVCTREQFEAYAKEREASTAIAECAEKSEGILKALSEQEGEKWTHTDRDICECRVISTEGNLSWIQYKEGAHHVVPSAHLKPIKPTLTKAEAWDKLSAYDDSIHVGDEYYELIERYDIV